MQGNGFYDPYSAYIKVVVENDGIIPDPTAVAPLSGKFLDRSAHSLINRLVIRSQGTELERIEQYDVMAAMINDMCYSSEQRQLHHYEGFAYKSQNSSGLNLNANATVKALQAIKLLNGDGPDTNDAHFGDRGFYKTYIPPTVSGANELSAALQHSTGITSNDPIGLTINAGIVRNTDIINMQANG